MLVKFNIEYADIIPYLYVMHEKNSIGSEQSQIKRNKLTEKGMIKYYLLCFQMFVVNTLQFFQCFQIMLNLLSEIKILAFYFIETNINNKHFINDNLSDVRFSSNTTTFCFNSVTWVLASSKASLVALSLYFRSVNSFNKQASASFLTL